MSILLAVLVRSSKFANSVPIVPEFLPQRLANLERLNQLAPVTEGYAVLRAVNSALSVK